MLHQIFLFLGQLWQLFEVSQILEFLRYLSGIKAAYDHISVPIGHGGADRGYLPFSVQDQFLFL